MREYADPPRASPGDLWKWNLSGETYVVIRDDGPEEYADGIIGRAYTAICLTTGSLEDMSINSLNMINWSMVG